MSMDELRREMEKGVAEIHARSVAEFNEKWGRVCAEIDRTLQEESKGDRDDS